MEEIKIDLQYKGELFKPIWKKLITAGRANEGLRAEWREQLSKIQQEIGFEYIRFHGVFHEDMMVYHEDENGKPMYNWQYIDSLLDFLHSVNLRPIMELSFTPYDMQSGDKTVFWWKGNITPPKDYEKWSMLVGAFVKHCINRYGKKEVLSWYFEVWNEPNLKLFWSGTQEEYFELYRVTAEAIKQIDTDMKVGGPASSGSVDGSPPWVEDFLNYCRSNSVPVDFVSTHPYPNTYPIGSDGNQREGYRDENGTYNSLIWLKDIMNNCGYIDTEVHITEWNASPNDRDLIHDTMYMAPFIIQNNIKCLGLADSLGFWAFTDIFEERGAGRSIFHGGFGLINAQGLEKPSYNGYWFLSRLGCEKLYSGKNYIVTRKEDKIQILMWNYCHFNAAFSDGVRTGLSDYDRYSVFESKEDKNLKFIIENLEGRYKAVTYVNDRENGSVFDSWVANGTAENPDTDDLAVLKANMKPKGSICYFENTDSYERDITIKPHGVVLIELSRVSKFT
ncbi:GH39 family glycosyl hydrolase [Ruminiclostridium cellobioparum]|uniref:GH39 family glycosyl hydrolase n=1 Tax=Ruminiclostridium cellobioparum TaxID=29355 RepID=UPI0028AF3C10|nr:xylan 1,4-beta-xylosidase [Ruminiclostridium cellobioparum]